jgi:hypothetical protein
MRWPIAVLISLLLGSPAAMAQIYTCTAEDGTRVFSDKRCGPDAKVVKNIAPSTRPATKTKSATVKVEPKSPEELQLLLKRCNEGDEAACMTWSKGGGPKQLRALEKEQEASCEAGSLSACEQRYCRDGATEECRSRVKALATVSGENWYLRFQQKLAADAPAVYSVRCLGTQSREIHDIVISCAPVAGPQRCQAADAAQGFPRLDAAATNVCATAR